MKKSDIYRDAESRMKKSVESTRQELAKIRTGRASPELLDTVRVEYFGAQVPIKQIANITVPEPRLLAIQPWDKSMIGPIEKAILKSDLGLNPTNDGRIIRIQIPTLTEERRRDLVRLVRKLGEEGRIAIRNIRRDANDAIKKREKAGELSEDEARREKDEIQELTDEYISKIDEILKQKEEEIMEV